MLFALLLLVLTAGCLEERLGTIVYEEVAVETNVGSSDPLANGRHIYQTYCQGCHAVTGKGVGMPNQSDFTNPAFFEKNADDKLINSIANGVAGTPMPTWNDKLSEEDIKEVLKFVKSFAGK